MLKAVRRTYTPLTLFLSALVGGIVGLVIYTLVTDDFLTGLALMGLAVGACTLGAIWKARNRP